MRSPRIIKLKQKPILLVEINDWFADPDTIGIGNGETQTSVMNLYNGQCFHIDTNLVDLGLVSKLKDYESFVEMLRLEEVYVENPYKHPDDIPIQPASLTWWMEMEERYLYAQSRIIDPTKNICYVKNKN